MNSTTLASPLKDGIGAGGDPEYQAWAAARRSRLLRRRLLPALGILGLLGLWAAVIEIFKIQPFIAPSPWAVLQTLYDKREILLENLLPTAIEAAAGFVLGNLAAIAVATVFVHNKTVQEIFFPVVLAFNAIPLVAKAPVLVLIMGNGIEPKITIAALVCFFPTLVNMVRGLESVNPQAMELMRVLSASKTEIFFRLRLLNALPYLFSSLRIAASMCVIGAVIGEWVGATQGVGAMILQATFNFDSPLLYAAIVMSASLSCFFFLVVAVAERMVIRWQPENGH
ncbi:MAG TPA: ABC transporter permease [Pseudorhodoferax sp.]|jgi:NitT/TauT family transport system permease protein|nr:ABC transporter permease [Pseudorhodoferax sp.]